MHAAIPTHLTPLLFGNTNYTALQLGKIPLQHFLLSMQGATFCTNLKYFYMFWHVYVLGPAYFVWTWKSRAPHVTSRTECNIDVTPGTLTASDTCIGYHVTRFEASQNVILHTRYVSTCVGAVCGRGRGTKINITDRHNNNTCDKYKSSLRHIHDPVLLSLKMKSILLFLDGKWEEQVL
jgi:hypothetical protein